MTSRLLVGLVFIVGLTGAGLTQSLPTPFTPPRLDKLDPLVRYAALSGVGRTRAIVRAANAAALDAVAAAIQAAGGTLGRRLELIDAQAADLPSSALLPLSALDLIGRISADRLVAGTVERTSAAVGVDAAREAYGYDGRGVGVAVIDSGITPWHDDLAGSEAPQRVDQFIDLVNGGTAPYDDYGHGTHVSGIIAGNGFDSHGRREGMAPASRMVVVKALDHAGRGRISDVIAAFECILAERERFDLRVVNVSVGAAVYESYDRDPLTLAAKRVVDAGLVVVAAAGNHGRRDGRTQYVSITAPGNAPWVLTVGAFSHNGTVEDDDDGIAAFSSRGPTSVDYAAKPDLAAPGVGIESLSDPASAMYTTRSSSLIEGSVATSYLPYLSLSGTSQATPVVSGTVALMLQANPALTPNAVKAILQYSARRAGHDALTEGAGFLNAAGAIALARHFAAAPEEPHPLDPTWSRQLIWGTHRISGGWLHPGASAWAPGVPWGAATHGGQEIAWGLLANQEEPDAPPAWSPWKATCQDASCSSVDWGGPGSENVVWGDACDGGDCSDPADGGDAWTTSREETIVWGTSGEDTIVWGTSDTDTIVWGTSCDDPSCGG